jgi:thymidine kinase
MNKGFPRLRQGWIEVIVGCMFSGKTEELLKQVRRTQFAKQKCQLFKPIIDTRYSENHVTDHNQNKLPSIVITNSLELLEKLEPHTEVVAIDEAQFFDENIVEVATELANLGRRVVIAGLDTDWRGQPFGPMPQLMAVAEIVRKQHAICMVCGEPASRTQRLVATEQDILLGSSDIYEARCRTHFDAELVSRLPIGDKNNVNGPTQTINPYQ